MMAQPMDKVMEDKQLHLQQYFSEPPREAWEAAVEKVLKGKKAESLRKTLFEGLQTEPVYGPQEIPSYLAGYPDQPPFARGQASLQRRQAGWDIRQVYDCGHTASVAEAIKKDLERGVSSVWLVPQFSSGAQEPGLGVHTLEHLESVLEAVDLSETPVSIAAGTHVLPALASLLALARKRGNTNESLMGSVYADPIGTLAACGQVEDAWPRLWRDVAEAMHWAGVHAPELQLLCCSGFPYHDAGASAVHELAFVLATAVESFRALVQHGLSVDLIAPRTFVQLGIGRDMFLSIAKLRAMRLLWAKVVKACGGSEASQALFLHACTSRVTAARRDPWVNLLRNTAEGFSAAVSGADAISLTPFDRALGVPSELARRMASHTQLILKQEAHIGRVIDPAGGSWYVESMTDQLARAAWSLFQEIEEQGGMIQALVSGFVESSIAATVADKRKAVARRKEPILGVSEYAYLEEEALVREPVRPFRGSAVESPPGLSIAMNALTDTNERVEMLMAWALQGETVQSLFAGLHSDAEPVQSKPLERFRWAEDWEGLREQSDAFVKEQQRRPRVFLANLGAIPSHKARAGFAGRFFEAGGFESIGSDGFSEPALAAQAFAESGADGVVICGSDEDYSSMVKELAPALSALEPKFVVLAGRPGDLEEAWTQAGVTHFIYLGCDALATLKALQQTLENAS